MKKKNFKILKALFQENLRQSDLVRLANISSEARMSRIINCLVSPTQEEESRICSVLHISSLDKEEG